MHQTAGVAQPFITLVDMCDKQFAQSDDATGATVSLS